MTFSFWTGTHQCERREGRLSPAFLAATEGSPD